MAALNGTVGGKGRKEQKREETKRVNTFLLRMIRDEIKKNEKEMIRKFDRTDDRRVSA